MFSSWYSLGFIAALASLTKALPTKPNTPSIEDLTSAGTSEVPELPSSTGSGADFPDNGSSFMGFGFSNDIDLGNLEEFPEVTTDFIVGSLQGFGEDKDNDKEDEDEKAGN